MYLSDGKLNRKIIALCSVFVRIDHIYIYIYICGAHIWLWEGGLALSFASGPIVALSSTEHV